MDTSKLKELRNALSCWQGDYDRDEDKEQYDMFGNAIDAVARLETAERRIAELEAQAEHEDAVCIDAMESMREWRLRAETAEAELARRDKAAGEPVGEILLGEYDNEGLMKATVHCLHDQADWENFRHGTKLYTEQPPVSAMLPPEMENIKDNPTDDINAFIDGWNAAIQEAKALGAQQEKVVVLPGYLSYAGVPAEYPSYAEEIAHQRGHEHGVKRCKEALDAAGIQWEVKK